MLDNMDRPLVSRQGFIDEHRLRSDRFQSDLLQAFQIDWFEVATWPTKSEKETPEFLAPDIEIVASPAGSSVRKPRTWTRSARRNFHSESGLYKLLISIGHA